MNKTDHLVAIVPPLLLKSFSDATFLAIFLSFCSLQQTFPPEQIHLDVQMLLYLNHVGNLSAMN